MFSSAAPVLLIFLLIFSAVAILVIGRYLAKQPKRNTQVAPTPITPQPPAQSAPKPTIAPRPTHLAPAPVAVLPHGGNLPYRRIPTLLTAAERDLHAVLQNAVPSGLQLFAQVRLANLVDVLPQAKHDKTHWYRIQAKCVDFVVCAAHDTSPRLVIELDDRSHDRADRRERDAFVDSVLATVGLPILHIRWQRQYDAATITQQIHNTLGLVATSSSTLPITALPSAAPASFYRPIPIAASQPVAAAPALAPQHIACGQCHAELRPQARFCNQCGATFSAA